MNYSQNLLLNKKTKMKNILRKLVSVMTWNNKKAKVDIREWDEKHEKMGKGITLGKEELKHLKDILNQIDIEKLDID